MSECNRDGCKNEVGRFHHGGGMEYCSESCEIKSLHRAARDVIQSIH